MKKIIFFLIVASLLLSCSLDRTNPLDPNSSGIQSPPKVTGIYVSIITNNWLLVTWNAMPNDVDGYYIYRSMSFNGYYELIQELAADDNIYNDIDVDIMNDNYWYKMSAFKFVDDKKMEGMRSDPHTWGAK